MTYVVTDLCITCKYTEIQKFVEWVKKKDPQFVDVNCDTKDRRRKRKK